MPGSRIQQSQSRLHAAQETVRVSQEFGIDQWNDQDAGVSVQVMTLQAQSDLIRFNKLRLRELSVTLFDLRVLLNPFMTIFRRFFSTSSAPR